MVILTKIIYGVAISMKNKGCAILVVPLQWCRLSSHRFDQHSNGHARRKPDKWSCHRSREYKTHACGLINISGVIPDSVNGMSHSGHKTESTPFWPWREENLSPITGFRGKRNVMLAFLWIDFWPLLACLMFCNTNQGRYTIVDTVVFYPINRTASTYAVSASLCTPITFLHESS